MRTLKALCDTVRFVDDRPSAGEFEFDLSRQIAHFESQALEVRPGTSPRLHAMLQTVTERLQLDAPIRCFISSEPTPNACAWIGSSSEVIIELHAGLVRLCDGDDLAYVIGHEIGHVGLRHGDPDGGPERGSLAWRYRRRCAEISADRVGMIAARSTLACAKAVMKVASGLPIEFLRIDVEAYLEQVTQDASSCHVLSTHPSLPVRLRALDAFATSRVYRSLTGQGMVGREMWAVDGEVR